MATGETQAPVHRLEWAFNCLRQMTAIYHDLEDT